MNLWRNFGRVATLAVLLTFMIVIATPLVWAASASVHSNANIYSSPFQWVPSPINWQNYPKAWNAISFGREMINSAIIGVIITVASVTFGLMAAYGFTKFSFPGRKAMFWSVVSVLLLPFPAIMVPVFELARSLGLVNSYLGVIVPGLVSAQGVFLMRQYLLGFPDDLLQAARIDGSSELKIFVRIVFPLCWPVVVAVGILTFVGSWNNLLWPYIVINDTRLYTIPLGLEQFNTQFFTDYVSMVSMSVVGILPVIALFLVSRRKLLDSVMMSGGGLAN